MTGSPHGLPLLLDRLRAEQDEIEDRIATFDPPKRRDYEIPQSYQHGQECAGRKACSRCLRSRTHYTLAMELHTQAARIRSDRANLLAETISVFEARL